MGDAGAITLLLYTTYYMYISNINSTYKDDIVRTIEGQMISRYYYYYYFVIIIYGRMDGRVCGLI